MCPKLVDKENRRQEIAQIALEVFADKGFSAASIANVASAAGMGKGTLYEYFTSKEELISAALLEWLQENEAAAQEFASEVEDPAEQLSEFLRAAAGTFASDDRTVKLTLALFQELLGRGETGPHAELIQRAISFWRQIVVDILMDGVHKGTFRPYVADKAETIATNLMAYLDGIYMYSSISSGMIALEEHLKLHLDILISALKTDL